MLNFVLIMEKNNQTTIFIADDSEILRNHLITMINEIKELKIIGYAADTESSKSEIKRLKPDIVILDIRMPGEGGIAVLKDIKQVNSNITVIILTDYPYPQYRTKCMAEGADYFFEKSTETEKLIDTLKKIKKG